MNPLTIDFWISIAATIFCGAIIGIERQLRGKPAGIRTSILICLGTYIFVGLADSIKSDMVDPTRVIGQVVTGIGFLGAGVIMSKEGIVKGVTSAAIIWVLAAIGATIGLGHLATAVSLALVTIVVLIGVEFLEATFRKLRRGVHAKYHDENPRHNQPGKSKQ